ncbi:MAG: DUF2971 domain-containing protein [Hyphomicrobiales bacterium]|nr:MAG: DUF2971 domain-containing protein [Hyphomicrobiales bacterium]
MDDATRSAMVKVLLGQQDVLYHYCSTNTFQQIISNRTIRLSALTLSNDALEGKLVSAVIKRLAQANKVEPWRIERLMERVDMLENLFDGLGLCLSEAGDLLSQWRGYADDAHGFSIGFSRSYLQWLGQIKADLPLPGFGIHKVLYKDEEHESELRPSYDEMMKSVEAGALQAGLVTLLGGPRSEEAAAMEKTAADQLSRTILMLFFKWFLLKSDAFSEEREVRLISYFFRSDADAGVRYRATRNCIIPYREFALQEQERNPIVEVYIGPKQRTPVKEIEYFLASNGFGNVNVMRSAAPYR